MVAMRNNINYGIMHLFVLLGLWWEGCLGNDIFREETLVGSCIGTQ